MNDVIHTLDKLYFGNTLMQWAWALAIALTVLLAGLLIKRSVRRNDQRLHAARQMELI